MALRIDEKGKPHGVLTDWDLATVKELGEHHGDRRTGTIPFMAIDILCDDFWKGKIPRVYRHELEGYMWILPWVFLQWKAGKHVPHQLLSAWKTSDITQVAGLKSIFRDAPESR
jgi:hypothetical protein